MDSKEKALLYRTLISVLNDQENGEQTEDDKTFRTKTTKQIVDRDAEYTVLLKHFIKVTKIRNIFKEIFKWFFLLMIIVFTIVFVFSVHLIYVKYIKEATIQQIESSIPILVSALVSFVSVVFAVPLVITKYLFSTKEDKNITKIILHTQEHDTSGREWASKFRQIAAEVVGSPEPKEFDVEKKMEKYQEET